MSELLSAEISPSAAARVPRQVGTSVAFVLLLLAVVSAIWTPYPTESADMGSALADFSASHWLGTDQIGRDMLSLLMRGLLTSFLVSAAAAALGLIGGGLLGLIASLGRVTSLLLDGLCGFLGTFPALIAAVLLAVAMGPGLGSAILAIGVAAIPGFAKVTRDVLHDAGRLDYVAAGRLAGLSPGEIARRHVFPSLRRTLLAQTMLQLAVGVLAEASLSYVGLGAQAPTISLGLMLRDAQSYAQLRPLLVVIPGALVLVATLALRAASADIVRGAGRRNA